MVNNLTLKEGKRWIVLSVLLVILSSWGGILAAAEKPIVNYKKNMPLGECQTLQILNRRKGVTYKFELVSGAGEVNGSSYCAPDTLDSCSDTPVIMVTDSNGMQTFIEIGIHAPDTSKFLHVVMARHCTQEYPDNPWFCIETDHRFRICCWETLGYNCDGSINRQWAEGPLFHSNCCVYDTYPYDIHDCDYSCSSMEEWFAENYPAYSQTKCCPKIPDDEDGDGPPPDDGDPPPGQGTDGGGSAPPGVSGTGSGEDMKMIMIAPTMSAIQ